MRPWRILDAHIFRQLFGPFVFGLLGALIIIAFGPMNRAIKYLLRGGISPAVILEWFCYRVPEDMQFIFPVATLMAGLLGFAGLSKNGELTSMRAAGISLRRLLLPVLVFGLAATAGTWFFLNRFVPPAMKRSQDLWVEHFRATQPPQFKDNFTLRSKGNRLVSVARVNLRDPILERLSVRMYPEGPNGPVTRISAPRARWDPADRAWICEQALIEVTPSDPSKPVLRTRHLVHALHLEEGPEVFQHQERTPQELTPEELAARIDELDARGLQSTLGLRVELYLKHSFPFCVLIFAVLGAVMGITNSRSGGFMGFGVALVLTFVYYVMMSLSASLGKTGTVPPLVSAWLHNVVFFGVAAWRATQASNS